MHFLNYEKSCILMKNLKGRIYAKRDQDRENTHQNVVG